MQNRVEPWKLSGRTVLVTGASSGIGRETAVTLAALGARVVATGRRADALADTLRALGDGDHAVEPYDLGDLEGIPNWVKVVTARHGALDGLVHAAGIRRTLALRAMSLAAFQETFRVNVDSAAMLVKGLRQAGCAGKPSSVVLVSSVAAFAGGSAIAAYGASKAALLGLTRNLAIELAAEQIRVNAIAPGLVEGGMTDAIRHSLGDAGFESLVSRYPLGIGAPRDVALSAAFLLSDAARWITGQTLVVDGGFSAQ